MTDNRVIPTERPSDRPGFKILIEGSAVPQECQVSSITVTEMVNRIPRAKIVLIDGDPASGDFQWSSGDLFVPGKELEIQAGYHSQEEPIFKGIIIGHGIRARKSGGNALVVDCRDKAVKMTVGGKNACWRDKKDSDIFEEIIGKYALEKDVAATSLTHKELVQYFSTDWDFIVSRAEANGMMLFVRDGKIEIKKPDFSGSPVLSLLFGATMLDFEAQMDARTQIAAASAGSWDYPNQEVLEAEGADPSVQTPGNVQASDLAGVIGLDKFLLRHPGPLGSDELKAWADSRMLKSRISKVQGRVKFTGFAGVHPGVLLELGGVGDRFNGKAWVSGVRHELGGGAWTTDAQFGISDRWFSEEHDIGAPAASGLLPGIRGLHTGAVTSLEDPDGEDRIRVRIPMIGGDTDGVWSRVATLDAGEKRGSFFRPEIADEVLIGFLNEDPRNPVVLGMLNSSAKPAPIAAADDNHEKGFVTRSEMKVLFNDEKKSIVIQTPKGKSITIDEDAGSILIQDENNNKIEMAEAGITLESAKDITIKATGNLTLEGQSATLKASAQFKAEGSGGVELRSSGSTVIKGSMVQIN